jgi:hypothetical protein
MEAPVREFDRLQAHLALPTSPWFSSPTGLPRQARFYSPRLVWGRGGERYL